MPGPSFGEALEAIHSTGGRLRALYEAAPAAAGLTSDHGKWYAFVTIWCGAAEGYMQYKGDGAWGETPGGAMAEAARKAQTASPPKLQAARATEGLPPGPMGAASASVLDD